MNFFFVASVALLVQTGSLFADVPSCSQGNISGIVSAISRKLSVNVDVINKMSKTATGLHYYQDGDTNGKSAIYQHSRDADVIYLVSTTRLALINGSRCDVQEKSSSKWAPLIIDPAFDGAAGQPVFTLSDLFTKLSFLKFHQESADQDSSFQRYSTCVDKNTSRIRFNVTIPSKLTFADPFNQQMPSEIRVEILAVKNVNETEVTQDYIFRLSQYSNFSDGSRWDETVLLPPPGINCGDLNGNKPKVLPVFPVRFSVKSEYIDHNQSFVVHNEVFMDVQHRLIKYSYKRLLPYQPLSSTAPQSNLPNGDYSVVHDLTTGLQYIISSNNNSCLDVSAISKTSGDVELINNKTIQFKTAYSILIGDEKMNFSYVGQRYINGLLADVYIASVEQATKSFAYEMWIYNKTGPDSQKDFIVSLRVYLQKTSAPVLLSQHTLYELKPQDKTWPQNSISVRPCLSIVQNYSYLLVHLTTDKDASHIDSVDLEDQLRTKLAEMANVSMIRVTDFYFQPVNKTNIFAFFQLADRSSLNGTETSHFEPEIDVEQAHENLNRSLSTSELKLEVQGTKVWATKDALNFVPPYFSGDNGTTNVIVEKSGYSGGSMAALAFFMLVIGSVGGFGLAFFLWKRNRGIQYQIYE